ncbi:MAG: amidohydrolase family protein [Candidatus Nitrospinota bacterium M3_3B_026]
MPAATLKVTAKLLILDSSQVLDHASVIVHGGAVAEIGPAESLSKVKADRRLTLASHVVHPGLVNAHTHLDLSFLNGRLKPRAPFTEWIRALAAARAAAGGEAVDSGIRRGLARLMAAGTTLVGDISTDGRSIPLIMGAGLRSVVFHETLGFASRLADSRMAELRGRVESAPSSPLLTHGVSPHAVYSVSPRLMRAVARYAVRGERPLAIHLLETPEEGLFSRKGTGPFRDLLESFGVFDPASVPRCSPMNAVKKSGALKGALVIHFNHPGRGGLAALEREGAKVVVCPLSNRWFGREMTAPVHDILDRKIPLALGTDSLASNTDLDVAAEARALMREYGDIGLAKAFEIATEGGAKALGFPEGCGTLRPGAPFDAAAVLVKSGRRVNPLRAALARGRRVERLWVAGRELKNKENPRAVRPL